VGDLREDPEQDTGRHQEERKWLTRNKKDEMGDLLSLTHETEMRVGLDVLFGL
jgi:hypothetical protein